MLPVPETGVLPLDESAPKLAPITDDNRRSGRGKGLGGRRRGDCLQSDNIFSAHELAWQRVGVIIDIKTKGVTDWGDALTGKGVEVALMIVGKLVAIVQPWRRMCRVDS